MQEVAELEARIETMVGLNTEFKFALRYSAKRIEQLEAALRKIACKHVTEQPLWWQLEARAALAPEQDK
jgi:hypothetical protein